jgi:hypothetical protein
MNRIPAISALVLVISLSIFAQSNQGDGVGEKGCGMMDSSMACQMMKMRMMGPKEAFATSDGGVVVIVGNKMMKYDKDLNFKKEVELKIDSTAMNSMKQMMQQCPGMKSGRGADSSGMHR